jgi:hypothetical protein
MALGGVIEGDCGRFYPLRKKKLKLGKQTKDKLKLGKLKAEMEKTGELEHALFLLSAFSSARQFALRNSFGANQGSEEKAEIWKAKS